MVTLKIAFLLTQDLSSPSGLGRYLPWAKELARLGHEVRIIALHPDYANLPENNSFVSGVFVEYVGQMHVKKRDSKKTYFSPPELIWVVLKATYKLFRATLAKPVEVLLVGKPHPMNSLAALLVKAIYRKVRLIVDCDDNEASSNRFTNQLQRRIVAWFERRVPNKAQIVTSNTYFTLNRLESLGVSRKKLLYVPNGIDEERFGPVDPKNVEELRFRLGLQGKMVISYIGSMSLPSHSIDILLNAFVYIEDQIPNAVLMLVGGGEDLDTLKTLAREWSIEDRVLFVGRVPPDDVPYYYAVSSVSVDPVYDNDAARGRCPLKIFESWACGVPIVTSDVGDRKLLIEKSKLGLLVEPGDSKALSIGIIDLLNSTKMHGSRLAFEASAIHDYSWSNLLSKFNSAIITNR